MNGPRVVRIPLRVANSYLLIDKKTIIVDTGDPGYSPRIIRALQANGIKQSEVSMIFLTHGHIDHFGSVYELRKHLDVPVAIQRIDLPYFLNGTQAPLYPVNGLGTFMKAVGQNMQVQKRYGLEADIVFDEDLDLQPYGVEGTAIATPGHTLGSASIVLPEPAAAIVGDLLVHRNFLFGQPCKPPFIHDAQLHARSMENLLNRGIKEFYPGHGGPIGLEQLGRFIPSPAGQR
ncbi:MAG TPA: MBL fold metallo-hydrolase [Negativicutes bacterium]|nr:MBL fold metallo-hydrolase [Negativicutes bacterium]